MIIANSSLQMYSTHSLMEYQRSEESLTRWQTGENGQRQQETIRTSSENLRLEQSSSFLSVQQGRAALPPPVQAESPLNTGNSLPFIPSNLALVTDATDEVNEEIAQLGGFDKLEFAVLKSLIERLTGRKLQLFDAREVQNSKATAGQAPMARGTGLVYEASETTVENEKTEFFAEGIVRTADGQEIALSVQLNMSREFISTSNISVRAGDAVKDPLVINFDGNAAELGKTKFMFDIDVDGKLDEISFVGPGSGFLALDKNGDGLINDGSELFGALSGDGFADLARYDEDGNGWIDENDTVFAKLLIWSRDENGKDQLQSLQERNIGAIHLGQTATPFALKDDQNALHGLIRASGIYLGEDGSVGTVQQVDLVV